MALRFHLTIDSGSDDEPAPQRFGSLETAYKRFGEMHSQWKPFAWITEDLPDGGSKTHMRDGKLLPLNER